MVLKLFVPLICVLTDNSQHPNWLTTVSPCCLGSRDQGPKTLPELLFLELVSSLDCVGKTCGTELDLTLNFQLLLPRDTRRGRAVMLKQSESGRGGLWRFSSAQCLFPSKWHPVPGVPGTLSIPGAAGSTGTGMPAGEVQWLHTALLTDRWHLQEAQTPEFWWCFLILNSPLLLLKKLQLEAHYHSKVTFTCHSLWDTL